MRPWLLLAPALLALGILLLYPLLRVGWLSLQDYGLRQVVSGKDTALGLANYRELFADPLLWRTVVPNTVVFAVVTVALTVVLGTLVALLLRSLGRWGRGLLTTAILFAWALPAVTGTYVWIGVFDPVDGIVTQAASSLGLIDPGQDNWFTQRLPFYAIVTLNVVHHGFPFVAITVLAGLLTIPQELTEAAILDGAGAWRRFWAITVPTMGHTFSDETRAKMSAAKRGELGSNWKGDNAGYVAAHERARKVLAGQPCAHADDTCEGRLEAAFNHDTLPEFVKVDAHSGFPYSPRPEDYLPLCKSHHGRYDSAVPQTP